MRLPLARILTTEFFRFLCVGGFNTVFGYALYWTLLHVLTYRAAYCVSFVIGVFVSYLLNCRVVFGERPTIRGALSFPLVYLVQFAIGFVMLIVLVERLHLDRRVAPIIVTLCSVPLTFTLSRKIVSATRNPAAQAACE